MNSWIVNHTFAEDNSPVSIIVGTAQSVPPNCNPVCWCSDLCSFSMHLLLILSTSPYPPPLAQPLDPPAHHWLPDKRCQRNYPAQLIPPSQHQSAGPKGTSTCRSHPIGDNLSFGHFGDTKTRILSCSKDGKSGEVRLEEDRYLSCAVGQVLCFCPKWARRVSGAFCDEPRRSTKMLTLDGLEVIAVLLVMGLFIKVLEQFGMFEPVGGEGNIFSNLDCKPCEFDVHMSFDLQCRTAPPPVLSVWSPGGGLPFSSEGLCYRRNRGTCAILFSPSPPILPCNVSLVRGLPPAPWVHALTL